MVLLFGHYFALFYTFVIHIGILKPQGLRLPVFQSSVHRIIPHTFPWGVGFPGPGLCLRRSSALGCETAARSLSWRYSILPQASRLCSVCGRHFHWARNIYAATSEPPRLRSRRKEGGAGPLGSPSPALSCLGPETQEALQEVAPGRPWAPRLSWPLGTRITGQAGRLLTQWPTLAGKSHCPC